MTKHGSQVRNRLFPMPNPDLARRIILSDEARHRNRWIEQFCMTPMYLQLNLEPAIAPFEVAVTICHEREAVTVTVSFRGFDHSVTDRT
jgi:hypothetical protein